MKRRAALAALLLCLPLTASAHPGGTDANGGHYNRKTGEYHYHHGYPEHQHTDGVCPYNFIDKTGERSGTSSGASSAVVRVPTPVPTPTAEPTFTPDPIAAAVIRERERTRRIVGGSSVTVVALVFLGVTAHRKGWYVVFMDFIRRRSAQRALRSLHDIKPEALDVKPEVPEPLPEPEPKGLPEYRQLALPDKTVTPPEGYAIDECGLPYKTNRQYGWGREFNAFVCDSGRCYHRSKCEVLTGKRKRLIHRYEAMKKYKPCEICNPRTDMAKWWRGEG